MKKATWAVIVSVFLWHTPAKAQNLAYSGTTCPTSWSDPNFNPIGTSSLVWASCLYYPYMAGTGEAIYTGIGNNVLTMVVETGGSGTVSEYLGVDDWANPAWYFKINLSSSGSLQIVRTTPSGSSLVASTTVSMSNNMSVRGVFKNNTVGVSINGVPVLTWFDNTAQPGFGSYLGFGENGANQFGLVSLVGSQATAVPNSIPLSSIGITSFSNHVDMGWPAATDGTGGWGIWGYQILRNGLLVGSTTGLSFSDTTVVPGVGYTYQLKVINYMLNSATTTFTAQAQGISGTGPYPSTTPEGRQVGVRPTGAYWGATGENIDVRSGNVNFSLPLLSAQGMSGWSVGFSLSYNSQNWRKDNNSGLNWNFDSDVGYGFGWRLLAGSIIPSWNPGGVTANHFYFTDSTGAEYVLDVNNGNVWSSRQSAYIYYDANTSTLHFRDGKFWFFGCVSASNEADAGTMYPTLMQDVYGNQITITYMQATGATWPNSSGRIATITDVRAPSGQSTYQFTYTSGSSPHLLRIRNLISSGENFDPSFLANQSLSSPFDGTSFPVTSFLSSLAVINGTYNLTYNGSGELTRVTLPYGGYLGYDYSTTTYLNGLSYRDVAYRYLSKDGSTQTSYPFSHEPTPGQNVHQYTILDDPGGVGEKYWAFSTSGFTEGLVTQYQGRQLPGPVTKIQNDFTWAQDTAPHPNSYISSTLTTADPGQSYQMQKQTNQTVDIYGNVAQVQNFDWGNLTSPAKTYNYTYLAGSGSPNYITGYVMNRLLTAVVTDGSSNITLVQNAYDGGYFYLGVYHGPNSGPGTLTSTTSLKGTTNLNYYSNGTLRSSTVNGVTKNVSYTGSPNLAAPSQLTVGSLSQSFTYNPALSPLTTTGSNTDTGTVVYLDIARPSSSTSPAPYNLTTTYSYPSPTVTTAVVNGRWTRTTTDGLGRTIKVENGTGTTPGTNIVSQTDTAYDSCGCSPLGKMKQVSLPHASTASAIWTTYTYDGIGRTLSVLQPDGASTTTYSYQGNTVTVTDPAGAWKTYTSDAFGRLTTVVEPNPAGGTYTTVYNYDSLDHLILVTMARPTGTQTRTFNYIDPATSAPGALLRYTINPENGTVTYTYDSQNRLSTVVDAKNQKKVLTYDSYNRVTQVQRYVNSGGYVEDPMARTNFYYDSNPFGTSSYIAGRLAAVQYYGGHCSTYTPSGTQSGCDLIQEWYSYNQAGAQDQKTLKVTRGTASGSLMAYWNHDSEGRLSGVTYPSWTSCSSCSTVNGSHYTFAYDTMGRLNTMTDAVNTHTLVSGTTYGVANEILQMTSGYTTGVSSETHAYNGMFQLTQLTVASALNIQYTYSATQNNGKITSQSDLISGEQLAYTYDALNRLASAQTTQTGGTQWGQSYTYDGFGNLTDQTLIKGSAPDVHVAYNASNNLQTGDTADYNGNIGAGYIYDMDNRLVQPSGSTARYAYDVGNKRVWRGDTGVDELAFWVGKKLAAYQISTSGTHVYFALTSTRAYFGGKLISTGTYNSSGTGDQVNLTPVVADRLGSIGKFYPYGTERPSATGNDKEKFTGYFRDASTGLDYADQRYEQPGAGRFMTPDPYGGSAKASNPGTWNRYAYVSGDPINRRDPRGLYAPQAPGNLYDDGTLPPCVMDCFGAPIDLGFNLDNDAKWTYVMQAQVRQAERETIAAAVGNAAKRFASEDCAGLLLAPGENTAENRQALEDQLNQAQFTLMSSSLASASNVGPNVAGFTVQNDNDTSSTWIVEGGPFFTGQAAIKDPNGNYTGAYGSLVGFATGMSLSDFQELTIIHEFMHQKGIVGTDSGGESYTLPNGDTVSGSQGISLDVRDKCF
jgi:RHS repeat-associated protein